MVSTDITLEELQSAIRNVPDFPEEGIQFKDITPVLADARLLDGCISHLIGVHSSDTVDVVAGIDARGFIFGAAMARELGVGFVPIRKKGKLPWETIAIASLTLLLRNRKNGDRFQPLGMNPHVKLQDFFVGAGVPKRWRDRVPLIESNKGILWVAGSRLAEWGKVMPEHTEVTRLELIRPQLSTDGYKT